MGSSGQWGGWGKQGRSEAARWTFQCRKSEIVGVNVDFISKCFSMVEINELFFTLLISRVHIKWNVLSWGKKKKKIKNSMWKRLDSVLQTHINHCIIDRKHFEVGGSVENIHQPCAVNTGLPIGPTGTSSDFWRAPAANQDFVPYTCSILQLCSHARAWLVQHLVHLWVFCSNQRKGLRSQGQQYVWTVCYLCVCDGDVFISLNYLFLFGVEWGVCPLLVL